ncbi:amidase [Bacillus sp. FJAT-45066]|uniref:amidase n=1 Tax=Bacillus sp. FJAT-45066 TaxID=2011010 RepID=UPI000BB76194|nr:amidase [Bacillus sp. FJAT-45066]
MTNLYNLTATELSPLIQSKQVSPVELMKSILTRIEEMEPRINAYITLTPELALQQAKNAENLIMKGFNQGPLHGIPIGMKDNLYTKGIRTTGGSATLEKFKPDYNATVVKKLLGAGGVMTGKLNMHEFGGGLTNTNLAFGNTRNPWNENFMPGGSSGGSAAAIKAGLTTLATGSDTFGSIRVPASMCGIYGLKPTYGLVSSYGVAPLAWSLDHVGPMARSVSDLALMLNEMAGYDPKDPGSMKTPNHDYTKTIGKGIKGVKIGVPSFFMKGLEPDVDKLFKAAVLKLEQLGAKMVEIEIPELSMSSYANYVITTGEASSYHYERLQEQSEKFADDVRIFFQTGVITNTPQYVRAQQVRRKLTDAFNKVFEKIDILVGPTIPIVPKPFAENFVEQNLSVTEKCMPFTSPANNTGTPSLSVPIGLASNGLPVGMQLIGAHFSEKLLLQVGARWEKTNPLVEKR